VNPAAPGWSAAAQLEAWLGRAPRWFQALAALTAGLLLAMLFAPPLFNPGVFASDAEQNLSWAARLADPALFPGDRLVDGQAWFYGRPGLRLVYRLGLQLVGLEPLSKLVALLLGALLLIAATRAARALFPERPLLAGLLGPLCLSLLQRPSELYLWSNLQGGMARSFGWPLLLLGLAEVAAGRALGLAACLLLCALFYPPVLLVLLATAGLAALLTRPARPLLRTLAAALPAGLYTLWSYGGPGPEGMGAPPSFAEGLQLPVLRAGGMLDFLVDESVLGCLWKTRLGVSTVHAGLLAALGAALLWARGSTRAWRLGLALVGAGLGLYAAAYLLFFRLYHPTRYPSYALTAAVWVLGLALAMALLERRPALSAGAVKLVLAAPLSGLSLLFAANLVRVWPGPHDAGHTGLYRSPLPPRIVAALQALPIDALVAAHPEVAGEVPFFARRSTLVVADELSPYRMERFTEMRARARAVAEALFATDPGPLSVLRDRYRATHLLIDRRAFAPGYSSWALSYPELAAPVPVAGRPFLLATRPATGVVADEGDFLLLALDW
jgi:hypothetical protein